MSDDRTRTKAEIPTYVFKVSASLSRINIGFLGNAVQRLADFRETIKHW